MWNFHKVCRDKSSFAHCQFSRVGGRIWCNVVAGPGPVGEGPPLLGLGHQVVRRNCHGLGGGIGRQRHPIDHNVSCTCRSHRKGHVLWRNWNAKMRNNVRVLGQGQRQHRVCHVCNGHSTRHHLPIQESDTKGLFRFQCNGHIFKVPRLVRRHGRCDVHGIDFDLSQSHDVQGQIDRNHIVTVFHASHHFIFTARVDEISEFLQFRLPTRHIASPSATLAVHFWSNDFHHAVQNSMHVGASERSVPQIGPSVDIGVPKRLVPKQCIQHRDVALTTQIAHALRIARVCLRPSVGDA